MHQPRRARPRRRFREGRAAGRVPREAQVVNILRPRTSGALKKQKKQVPLREGRSAGRVPRDAEAPRGGAGRGRLGHGGRSGARRRRSGCRAPCPLGESLEVKKGQLHRISCLTVFLSL